MYFALFRGKIISARQASGKYCYSCLFCHQKVIVHHSYRPYFIHFNKNPHCGGESSEHLLGKSQLARFFRSLTTQIEIEHYLSAINQWPDVLIHHRLALEFQCSPISTSTLRHRINGYHRIGIRSWWILGSPYYYRNLRFRYLRCFFRYSINLGFYLSFWLVRSSCLEIRYHYREINGRLFYQTRRFYDFSHLRNFVHHRQQQPLDYHFSIRYELKVIQKRIYHQDPDWVRLQMHLTPLNLTVDDCPIVCHYPKVNPPIFQGKVVLWHILILIYLKKNCNLVSLYWAVNRHMRLSTCFLQIPLVKLFYWQAFLKYLANLKVEGYLLTSSLRVVTWRPPRWFRSEYDKLKFLSSS